MAYFFFQAEEGIRDYDVTGVQTCALPIFQKYLFIDPGIAYGPTKSVEALFAAIIGGVGTVLGPLLGSFFIHGVGEIAKEIIGPVFGDRPGVDLILFGLILIFVLAFVPRGLAGLLEALWKRKVGGRNA